MKRLYNIVFKLEFLSRAILTDTPSRKLDNLLSQFKTCRIIAPANGLHEYVLRFMHLNKLVWTWSDRADFGYYRELVILSRPLCILKYKTNILILKAETINQRHYIKIGYHLIKLFY